MVEFFEETLLTGGRRLGVGGAFEEWAVVGENERSEGVHDLLSFSDNT